MKKGRSYVTVVIDANERKVIGVEEGRDKETVKNFAQKLGNRENIKVVTNDMSTSYLPAIEENFENAKNVIDKFHVKKVLIDALDKVRKDEQKLSEDILMLFAKVLKV